MVGPIYMNRVYDETRENFFSHWISLLTEITVGYWINGLNKDLSAMKGMLLPLQTTSN